VKRKIAFSVFVTLALSLVLIVACGTPATPPPPVVQTVVVPQTVVSQQTVAVPQTVVAEQTVVVPQTVVAQQTVVVQPTSAIQRFDGTTINIVTFTGPQIAEPLQRRAPDFERLTGAKVNVITVPFSDLYQKILTDASTGTNSFDAYVFDPQWMGDFVTAGFLEDLSDKVKNDAALQWDDIAPFFRDFSATYNGKVYTIPLDGDFHMIYYRTDLLNKDGIKPPNTWDDYVAIAKKYQGQDLNGDGKPDYGSCISMKRGAQAYWFITSIAGGFIQSLGTSQGAFFNTDNMQPLIDNEGFRKAMEIYKQLSTLGPPDQLNLDVGDTRGLFTSGRCALSMDWGDIGPLSVDPSTSTVQDKVGAAILPGSTQVIDRSTGKLVNCDKTTCPNMDDQGVNHAPFAAYGGWSGAVNSNSKVKDAAYAFLSYMSQPAQANVDVTIGRTGFNPYRISQFKDLGPWMHAGFSEAFAKNYLGAIQDSLNSPNMILDLRIPQNQYYQQVVLDQAIAQYLAGELTEDQAVKQIVDGWNAKTDELGRDKQLAAYKASLGVAR
jgi:multiple sugar transport system substrate-binding protein